MTEPSLVGVWAKIARAKTHRDILEENIARMLRRKANHPRIGVKCDPETRESIVYVSRMRDFDPFLVECALVLGDLLHNLRSALDHLAYQLAIKSTTNTIRWPKRVQFPLRTCRRSFRRHAKSDLREVRGYRTRIERLQPYKRRDFEPNRSLGLLQHYNNLDKHRLLLPSVIALAGHSIGVNRLTLDMLSSRPDWSRRARPSTSPFLLSMQPWKPIELGTELYRWTPQPENVGLEMKVIGEASPTVTLGERYTLIKLCDVLVAAVTQVPGIFKDAFE